MEGFGWMFCSFSPPISASELLRLDRYCFLHTHTHTHAHAHAHNASLYYFVGFAPEQVTNCG